MLWKDSRLKVEVIGTIDQAISVAVRGVGQNHWIFTDVYASPCVTKREILWDYLDFVTDCQQLPWSIVGDFNMLCVEDKLGGALLC
ncbi:hypothetical protein ACFX1S_033355 [Malus domestica]